MKPYGDLLGFPYSFSKAVGFWFAPFDCISTLDHSFLNLRSNQRASIASIAGTNCALF
jgi:hypothetical protein